MWILNSLFLLLFAFALRRTFGAIVALGTLLFLAIDPTVAAHLPVVMTDLPIALLVRLHRALGGACICDVEME